MSTVLITLGVAVATLIGLMFFMQVAVRLRARALKGKPVPEIAGPTGKRITRAKKALVYFMSPGCAACRQLTPKMKELSNRNSSVFVVDISREFDIARALKVMATPSVIEIAEGKIVGYHVGGLPAEVVGRFS